MTSHTKSIFTVAAALLAAATVAFFAIRRNVEPSEDAQEEGITKKQISEAAPTSANANNGSIRTRNGDADRKRSVVAEFDEFANLSPEQRKIAESIQDALDAENFEQTRTFALKAMNSENSELRQKALDALSWFGERALVDITPYMADPDEDVADAAVSAWETALAEIDSATERLRLAKLVLNTSATPDALRTIGGEYSNAANEYIDKTDNEAEATRRRVETLQPVVDMIEGARKENSEAGKEIYEDITGNEWISFEEAELYLSDPENYETPDERAEKEDFDDMDENVADSSSRSTKSTRKHRGTSNNSSTSSDLSSGASALDESGYSFESDGGGNEFPEDSPQDGPFEEDNGDGFGDSDGLSNDPSEDADGNVFGERPDESESQPMPVMNR